MTQDELTICKGLGSCSIQGGGFDKRFARNLGGLADSKPYEELSDKQREWMYRLLYKYRRQMPNTYDKHKSHPHCQQIKKQRLPTAYELEYLEQKSKQ